MIKNRTGAQVDLTPEQQKIIALWAASTEWVTEVRLFGSRAKGQSRPDSDVDLALTLKTDGIEGDDAFGFYFFKWREWETELTHLLGLPADVEWYDEDEAPNVYRYCQKVSVLLYLRSA